MPIPGRSTWSQARLAFPAAALLATLTVPCGPLARAADEAAATGVRTLYLIRHGVYDEEDPRDPDVGRALTPEGEEQARLTGKRLAALGIRFDALHGSTMTRARQTAEIIGRELGMTPALTREIRECTPPTARADIMARQRAGGPDSCRATLDLAWARYFRPSPARDSVEVLVCHGNVIRYLVGRAIGLDPMLWLNMTIGNCSVSVVQVRGDGAMRLLALGDVGHLPPATQRPPVWRAPPAPPAR